MISSILRPDRAALLVGIVLSAVCTAFFRAQAAPCIDTNSQGSLVKRTMVVQQPGRGEIHVTGTITSLNRATGEVGVTALGIGGEQRIKPAVVRLQTLEPSMAAQMAIPSRMPLGPSFSAEFPFGDLSVDRGVIRYPHCTMPAAGHEIAFTGTLTFGGGILKVDGNFFDYVQPAGGGPSGIVTNKPG